MLHLLSYIHGTTHNHKVLYSLIPITMDEEAAKREAKGQAKKEAEKQAMMVSHTLVNKILLTSCDTSGIVC